jgi:hypothetical protein
MVTENQREATYHCGIGSLLRVAYQRDCSMLEMMKCKIKYPLFSDWYGTLKSEQRKRVNELLNAEYKNELRGS